jgi:hypothetical protein
MAHQALVVLLVPRRFSQDHLAPGASTAAAIRALSTSGSEQQLAADPLQQLWFQVLQCYVVLLRELRQEEQQLHVRRDVPAEEFASDDGRWQLELLQELFAGWLSASLSCVGYVCLVLVA